MLVHFVLFNFKSEVPDKRRAEILDLARKRLAAIPGVKHLLVGKALDPDSEYDYALCMYFEDGKALDAYLQHPDHVRFRDEEFFPFLDEVEGLDYVE